ncbi:MAG: ChaN family lipoprotein [Burkholderiaceae bacterium]|nr:ChaN family lipoprotein [Burkholderiaceae bacterium]
MLPRAAVTSLLICAMLGGCASVPASPSTPSAGTQAQASSLVSPRQAASRVQALLPADVLLLGEQHDVPAHQQIQQAVVQALAAQGVLAALTLEMAPQGGSTAGLPVSAGEAQVRSALRWDDDAWPWTTYGPVVMEAVRAGVPVLGANLPRNQMRSAMQNKALDNHLTLDGWQKQQENIREGHCGLLPETQIVPMARIQLARDAAMAQTVLAGLRPGKVVVLIAGNGHADAALGVPTHLERLATGLSQKSVRLSAVNDGVGEHVASKEVVWITEAPPPRDYCAGMKAQMAPGKATAPAGMRP